MSDRDEVMSLSDSVSNKNSSDESCLDEMQVVGNVQPYANEPLVHTSNKDKDDKEDQDGRSVLRARFEDEVTVKDWLVPVAAGLKCLDVKLFLLCVQKFEFKLFVYVVGARMANVRKKI